MVSSPRRAAEDSGTHNWDFTQCFGDKSDLDSITEGDVISTVEFDNTGNFLATGDRGGRVVLFKREDSAPPGSPEYRFYTEFQSHDREFDYLKSLEIEEKINQIRWCQPTNNARYLLSTNDKTIKLWKVFEKSIQVVAENNGTDHLGPRSFASVPMTQLRLPRMNLHDTIIATAPRRTYANAHVYHINSIGVNSDGETFLSSDDLRINLWNLGEQDRSFNIVDIRPASMEELTEVITATECHPTHCNEFIYSTCKGNVRLADMRERALCDEYAKIFEDPLEPVSESFFTEITSSISDIKYAQNGRYIVARDFMTVKIWDVAMERAPVETIHVHDNIKQWLCTSYETDSIFDKFEVEVSGDSRSIMTGSYSSNFFIYPHVIGAPRIPSAQPQGLSPGIEMGPTVGPPLGELGPGLGAEVAGHKRNMPSHDSASDEDAMDDSDEESDLYRSRSRRAKARGTRHARREAGKDSFELDDADDERDVVVLTADKNVFRKRSHNEGTPRARMARRNSSKVDFRKNILHLSWHPFENTVAIAATNNLFVFNASQT